MKHTPSYGKKVKLTGSTGKDFLLLVIFFLKKEVEYTASGMKNHLAWVRLMRDIGGDR
jgi:hypothetical protein